VGIATLAGHTITSARITIPAWGLWYAEVSLDGEHTLTAGQSVELKAPGLTLRGAVLAGGPVKGRSAYRIVAGAGGWGRVVAKKGYSSDAGVRISTVISDAAAAVGETVSITTDARTGPSFEREEGRASLVLQSVAPQAWHVDEAGVTRLGARTASTLTTAVPRTGPADLSRGTVTLAPTTLAGLLPGITVDGIVAVDVVHEIEPKGVRTTIYGARGGGSSRRLEVWQKLFEQLDPDRDFRAVWEYRVVLQSGDRLELQPVLASSGMPDLRRVRMRPGVSGANSTLALGSHVLVAFVNGSRGRPVVVGFADAESDGFTPILTEIDASTFVRIGAGTLPVARGTDLAGGIWPIVPSQVKVLV
jgi:hypothetical protein